MLAVERVKPRVGRRSHGRRPRDVAQQRDLAEEVARAGVNGPAARIDRQLAAADDVEAVTDVAGANDDVSRRNVDLGQVRGDALLRDERERREEGHVLDQSELRRRAASC